MVVILVELHRSTLCPATSCHEISEEPTLANDHGVICVYQAFFVIVVATFATTATSPAPRTALSGRGSNQPVEKPKPKSRPGAKVLTGATPEHWLMQGATNQSCPK